MLNLIVSFENGYDEVEEGKFDFEIDIISEEVDIVKWQIWSNKVEYIFVIIGFVVGFGNLWRFLYLCQKNGGGRERFNGFKIELWYYVCGYEIFNLLCKLW